MTVTYDIYQELVGLYVNIMVANRFRHELNESELMNIREKNAQYAERLDALGVPWTLQNRVAYAATVPANWQRYNRDVMNEIIHRYNNKKRSI